MTEPRLLYRHQESSGTGWGESDVIEIFLTLPSDTPEQVEAIVQAGGDCVAIGLGTPAEWRAACLEMAADLAETA